MAGDPVRKYKVKVIAEAIADIVDDAALESAALEAIDSAEFVVEGGESTLEEVRESVREEVRGDPFAALSWLADPCVMVEFPGVEVVGSEHQVVEVGEDERPVPAEPPFADLFPVCRCGKESCEQCEGFQFTPRTAAALWTAGQILADRAYDDIAEHGDEPAREDGFWSIFDEYPRITWRQNSVWRRQAARSFDDLAADLAAGDWPQPRCPGEEMALYLMLRCAKAEVADDQELETASTWTRIAAHPEDFCWHLLDDVLFQDLDILNLFDAELDGIEDPAAEPNLRIGMGDYRPSAWFETFMNMEPRDGRRPFRR